MIALAALALLQGRAALAADKELLDILLANGAINQQQHDELMQKEELSREDVRDVIVTLDRKGLRARSSDGAFAIKLGARLHADASGAFGSDAASGATDGTEIRRARLNFQGTVWEDFLFHAEADFADNKVTIKDFLVGYQGFDWGTITAGNQKQPFSLALEMSSNDIPFIERGVDTDLVVPFTDRAIGFRTDAWGDHWFVAAGIFGDSPTPDSDDAEGWGSSVRAVWAPVIGEDRVVHLGVRGSFRQPDDNSVRIRAETDHMSNLYPVNTGTLTDVQNAYLIGPEAAVAIGPFSLVGEYYNAFLDRDGMSDLVFNGWHAEATWSLTGESRASSYKIGSGEFKGLAPARNFSLTKGDWGAWEVAARMAGIDADDEDVNGGHEGVVTLGLNWYLNQNVRVMFDWSRIVYGHDLVEPANGLNTFQGRVDFHF
jgi:phosphate-selective porin OprO/OprP